MYNEDILNNSGRVASVDPKLKFYWLTLNYSINVKIR